MFFYPDLAKEYIPFSDFGPCEMMKEGDVFITTGPFGNECPKVLLLNGSPRKAGCTFTALSEIASVLEANGIEAEIFQAGDPSRDNVKVAAPGIYESMQKELRDVSIP